MSIFHRHRFNVSATHHMYVQDKGGISPSTAVLVRCACGDFKSYIIEGFWSVENFRDALKESDQEFCRKVGVKL